MLIGLISFVVNKTDLSSILDSLTGFSLQNKDVGWHKLWKIKIEVKKLIAQS